MPRALHEVVFVDGVRTPFGKAGDEGHVRPDPRRRPRHPVHPRAAAPQPRACPRTRVEEVAIAATTQIGDQGLTLGRTAALLAGLPNTTPGYSIDRMCAGAMTAVTNTASSIAFGAYDVAIAGGVEHMGRHPMGEGVDPNPRFVSEKLVDPSALVMGKTAENLHDRFPQLTKERADAFAVRQPGEGRQGLRQRQDPARPGHRSRPAHAEQGWGLATADEPPRPGTTAGGARPRSRRRSAPHGRVTAGNAAGLNDGATACLLASEDAAARARPAGRGCGSCRYAFVGVEPEVMGIGPVPATEKALAKAGLDDRRHRPVRAQRGLRRAGARLPRPLRHRRRRPAGQPVRRRHRHRPPARLLRRAPDDPARPPVRGAPRGALRPDRHVHRHRHGRHRHLGEPAPDRRAATTSTTTSEHRQ